MLLPLRRRSFQVVDARNTARCLTSSLPSKGRRPVEEHTTYFRNLLGSAGVICEEERLVPFNRDWLGKYEGTSPLVLQPRDTDEVSKILSYCNRHGLPVVPQGGNTGLVGGGTPTSKGEIVLSLSRMNAIESFDPNSGVLVCQSGCILQNLQDFLGDKGFVSPLDLGARGSCQIGGNVSTNAGGVRFVRHGSLHGSILGLEVVLADGRVLDMLSTMRKNNTGYPMSHLFIGAEGTLGVVTKVSICTPVASPAVNLAFLALSSFSDVVRVASLAKSKLGEIISAVEFIDSQAVAVTINSFPGIKSPFPSGSPALEAPCFMLIETSGACAEHDNDKLQAFLESSFETGLVQDGVIAQDGRQVEDVWSLREHVSSARNITSGAGAPQQQGYCIKFDVSLPLDHYYALVQEARQKWTSGCTVFGYGHLGDCNLHLNILVPERDAALEEEMEEWVFRWVVDKGGSLSAEHGVGQGKARFLTLQRPPEVIRTMHVLKDALDPKGIMNPFKVLPPKGLEDKER